MGLHRDIDDVSHQEMLLLDEKWVITISTQDGCSMECKFCDVPKVGKGINATRNMRNELYPYIGKSLIRPVVSTMDE